MNKNLEKTINYLKKKKKILFLITSNRWVGESKEELLAKKISKIVPNITIINVSKLNIVPCEGNISSDNGNDCGLKNSVLNDKTKNPNGYHRCWASLNNQNDELWKISKELFESDCVLFFTSVRWGQTNSIYQKLIERLSWIENRHASLGEDNIVKNIDAGIIVLGHNWNGKMVLKTQKQVMKYFGFKVINDLCWDWSYTKPTDESLKSYKEAIIEFRKQFL